MTAAALAWWRWWNHSAHQMTSASAARDAFAFLRRCWTGEDMTWASGAGGCLMLVGILWLVETIGSNALRAFGLGEPVATVGGWAIAGTYLVLGGIHDWRALHRREARQAARRRSCARSPAGS